MADALNGHAQPLDRIPAQPELHAGFDPAADAERGVWARIAGAAVLPLCNRHMLGDRTDDLHVLDAGAAVFRRDVVPAQIVDELSERAKQRGSIEFAVRTYDH